MITYSDFLQKNYNEKETVSIMSFSQGQVVNKIWKVASLQRAAGASIPDTYMTMNPLGAKGGYVHRDQNHVQRLKWLYVDLDYYHTCYKDFTKQQILGLLEMDYFGQSIPMPTYVIDSGRGLYLLWKIDEHTNAISRWIKVQKYLTDQLKEFGADYKVASDSARVLRRIGSINSKTQTEVCVLQYNDVRYSLTAMLREIIGEQPSEKMMKYAESISKTLGIPLPEEKSRFAIKQYIQQNKALTNFFCQQKAGQKRMQQKKRLCYLNTEYSLIFNRLKDLELLLLKYRDREGGCREHILFLYRYWQLCITDRADEALDRTIALNSRLTHPLADKEVIKATASAEKYYKDGKKFRCSNSYVIDALNITATEMSEMSVFVSYAERKRRKKDRNKVAYELRLQKAGKKTKTSQIRERQIMVHKLLKKGYSVSDICNQCGISRATFFADKQKIEGYLACRKEHAANQYRRYREFCKKIEKTSLKISAFVLNMSFRTCPVALRIPSSVVCLRALRSHFSAWLSWQGAFWRTLSSVVGGMPCSLPLQRGFGGSIAKCILDSQAQVHVDAIGMYTKFAGVC